VLADLSSSTSPGPGFKSMPGCKIMSSELGTYAIGLISWTVSEGSKVSSLICDRPTALKLVQVTTVWHYIDSIIIIIIFKRSVGMIPREFKN